MDLFNSLLNLVIPPASLVMLAFAWPTLSFIHACEWLYYNFYSEDMENKVVLITGASSGIGEQIAYEYAKRHANLVLVARRDNRLRWISENALQMGARHVMIIAADVVKEEECRRFITETFNYYGRLDHLVNTASLGHTFYFEEVQDTSVFPLLMDINFWGNVYPTYAALPYLRQSNGRIVVNASIESWLPMPRMSLYAYMIVQALCWETRKVSPQDLTVYMSFGTPTKQKIDAPTACVSTTGADGSIHTSDPTAAKAAVTNFYETLRIEARDDVGVTIATHGWIGGEMTRGKFMLEEGAEMQWKEEREVPVIGSHVEEYARMIVAGACRGDAYVKLPSWYDIFLLYRVFAPDVLGWTFGLLFSNHGAWKKSHVATGRPLLETSSPRKLLPGPLSFSQQSLQQQYRLE